ncbi:MAG: PilW family protein [Halofilum sp. (in: g-proteobacteria)]|nr:PilW family protein [Halofilum sp. (in: g-proteobacteria)]
MRKRQTGFSLTELMIAAVIGLLLLGGVITISISSSRTQRELEQVGRQVENGRYAIEFLGDSLRHAGYYGEYYQLASPPGALPDPCSTALGDIEDAMPLPIQGYDNPTGVPPISCLSDAQHRDGTDILVIRRVSTSPTDIASLTNNDLYLQTRADSHVLAQATGSEDASSPGSFTLDKRDGSTANIRKFHVEIYFIGPNADNVPTLKRLMIGPAGGSLAFQEQELVDGIEYFEIEYGIDRSGDGSPNETAAGTGDAYETTPTVAEFADVVALKVHLVARSIGTLAGHTDTKTYDLGLETDVGPLNDGFRRRAYSMTTRATNIALRRE